MIPFSLSSVVSLLHAKLINTDQFIKTISIDSRVIGEQCLFIALKGCRFDGHDFVMEAIIKGAKALLVNYYLPLNISQLVVFDTRYALIKLGFLMRYQSTARMIAITGSVGKTSVKEMTSAILCNYGKTVATYGNFNNDIGVALTLLRLNKQDDFAVIELGTSSFGEISKVIKFVCPEVVLVNNISYAHLSGFRSLLGVARAKGEIFSGLSSSNNGRCIINADSHNWSLWRDSLKYKLVWWFALRSVYKANFFATNIICNTHGVRFTFHTPQGKCNVSLPLLGYHNIANALAAGALAMSVGVSLFDIRIAFKSIKLLPGRLYPIILCRNKILLDDSYNSNIGSMIAAIQVLSKMPGYRIMVVSDMLELGDDKEIMYHAYVGKIISISSIDAVLSMGYLSFFLSKETRCGRHFCDRKSLIVYLMHLLVQYEVVTVLIKGSRMFAMDVIVKELQEIWLC